MPIPTFENTLRLAALLASPFIVLVLHTLVIGLWQRSALRRVRRNADAALTRGSLDAIRRASAEAAEARRDWPGADLREVGNALEISARRLERPARL